MNHYRPVANADEPANVSSAQLIACPTCSARFIFYRSNAPRIDECGFESYSFACEACGTPLAGIIDPFDEALLLSNMAA